MYVCIQTHIYNNIYTHTSWLTWTDLMCGAKGTSNMGIPQQNFTRIKGTPTWSNRRHWQLRHSRLWRLLWFFAMKGDGWPSNDMPGYPRPITSHFQPHVGSAPLRWYPGTSTVLEAWPPAYPWKLMFRSALWLLRSHWLALRCQKT